MTEINRATVENVAALANLKLSEEELDHYESQLAKVVAYFQQLEAAPDPFAKDWRPDLNLPETPEREDLAKTSLAIEKVLQTAPKVVGTAFQVPRIIE